MNKKSSGKLLKFYTNCPNILGAKLAKIFNMAIDLN